MNKMSESEETEFLTMVESIADYALNIKVDIENIIENNEDKDVANILEAAGDALYNDCWDLARQFREKSSNS